MYANKKEAEREVELLRATTVAAATNWKPANLDPDGVVNGRLEDIRHGKEITVKDYADLAELMQYEPDRIRATYDFDNMCWRVCINTFASEG